jgi:hypothetical protein
MAALLKSIVAFLRDALSAHVGLKALSLAFAIGLFVYLHGQQEQQLTLPVAVVLRLPPESVARELMTTIPPSVHITVRGSTRVIDHLVQNSPPPVEIDLRDGRKDRITFDEAMFALPSEVEISVVDPSSIDLSWEDVVSRTIPIQASITGQPAPGFVVKGEPTVEPAGIKTRGPVSDVEVIQFARVAAFDVVGLTEGVYRRRIAIDPPPNRVRYLETPSASVTVTIARRVSEVKFQQRPVEVIGLPGVVVVPRTVDVSVVGPPEVVRALRADQIVPRADLTQQPGIDFKENKHGTASIPVSVDLANAEAEIQPPTVTVKW